MRLGEIKTNKQQFSIYEYNSLNLSLSIDTNGY